MRMPSDVAAVLARHGQQHLLRHWDALSDERRQLLLQDIAAIPFDRLAAALRASEADAAAGPTAQLSAPRDLIRLPSTSAEQDNWRDARQRGLELLRGGRVGAILVAGGQGTRLGFHHPKGMFPIGPVSRKPLFQLFCEQLRARGQTAGRSIPYYVMTSDATDAETRAFFAEHHWFGLAVDDVHFFRQGSMPAVDRNTQQILLSSPDRVALSPDGHGGLLKALQNAGLFEDMRRRGIDLLYYHQVDNPAAVLCDPEFLGWHDLHGSDISTKAVAKRNAAERMGVLVDDGSCTRIIEYSDLPAATAAECDAEGRLRLWAGNTAMHVFRREFLESLTASGMELPFHRALKTVPYFDDALGMVEPPGPNAIKLEQFIFDALPRAKVALVVEADRAREFLPVKNHAGDDSPASCREGLLRLWRDRLLASGAQVDEGVRVEISPLVEFDECAWEQAGLRGRRFQADCVVDRPAGGEAG